MKKSLLVIVIATITGIRTMAQTPFATRDSLNINNINASVLLHGDMWWDPTEEVAKCFFPNGAVTNIAFTSALWMSGYDDGGTLHVASQTYRQTGNDYWPGPLYPGDTLTYATSSDWAKFWKVYRTDITTFLATTPHTTANTPASILNWPGKGNTYATGAGGVALSVTTDMAPFADLNGNGIYEPLLGEYPYFNGDEAIWWVFSDNGPTHNTSNAKPLGLEVHVLNYAYHRNTMIDNVVYYDYTIINRSANNYNNFRFAQWADMDLGYYDDDYIGFDSTWRMGIIYNGEAYDGLGMTPGTNHFGTHIPMAAVTLIRMPGDSAGNYIPVGSFTYYNNDNSIIGNPSTDSQYNNYMRSMIRNNEHFSDDFMGAGVVSKGYGAGPNTNYVFPGDPGNATQWSECASNNAPGDRRFIITTGDMTLPSGSVNTITMALITTWPDTLNACPGGTFDSIKLYADTAWAVYHNSIAAGVATVQGTGAGGYRLYPNPTTGTVHLVQSDARDGATEVCVTNYIGQTVYSNRLPFTGGTADLELNSITPGLYMVTIGEGVNKAVYKLVVEK